MQVESLQCNHCGAPLDVGPATRFAKCEHCGSRLTIVRNSSATYTELVEKMDALDAKVNDSLATSQFHLELERIDREWDQEQAQFLSTDKHGNRHRPSKAGNAVGMIIGVGFLIFWIFMAVTIGAAFQNAPGPFPIVGVIFPLFGVVLLFVVIAGGISNMNKADKYDQAYQAWQTRRKRLIEQHERSDEGIKYLNRD